MAQVSILPGWAGRQTRCQYGLLLALENKRDSNGCQSMKATLLPFSPCSFLPWANPEGRCHYIRLLQCESLYPFALTGSTVQLSVRFCLVYLFSQHPCLVFWFHVIVSVPLSFLNCVKHHTEWLLLVFWCYRTTQAACMMLSPGSSENWAAAAAASGLLLLAWSTAAFSPGEEVAPFNTASQITNSSCLNIQLFWSCIIIITTVFGHN